ncbi:MAG: hypothetical protein IKR85_01980 [Clostridia bacterium]|nr:hypothetical protein [Clostridia bacterium]
MKRILVLLLACMLAATALAEGGLSGLSGLDALIGNGSLDELLNDSLTWEELLETPVGDTDDGLWVRVESLYLADGYDGEFADGYVYLILAVTAGNASLDTVSTDVSARLSYTDAYVFEGAAYFELTELDMLVETAGELVFSVPEKLLELAADKLVLSLDAAGDSVKAKIDISEQAKLLGIELREDAEIPEGGETLLLGDVSYAISEGYKAEIKDGWCYVIASAEITNTAGAAEMLEGAVSGTLTVAGRYVYRAKCEYPKLELGALEAQTVKLVFCVPQAALKYGKDALELKVNVGGASVTKQVTTENVSRQHAYKVFSDVLTWEEAEQACERMGGHLAVLTARQELDIIWNLYDADHYLWLGGYADSARAWHWVTGEQWYFTLWNNGQPDNYRSAEDKLQTYSNKRWNDAGNTPSSTATHGYICEWENTALCPFDDYTAGYETAFPFLEEKSAFSAEELKSANGLLIKKQSDTEIHIMHNGESDASYRYVVLPCTLINTSADAQVARGSIAAQLTFRDKYVFDAEIETQKDILEPLETADVKIVLRVPKAVTAAEDAQLKLSVTLAQQKCDIALDMEKALVGLGVSVGDTVAFGVYEQDNNTENGSEPIEWKVIAVDDDRAMLYSVYALDSRPYHSERTNVLWYNSQLRTWLNTTFIETAFNAAQQKLLSEQNMFTNGWVSVDKAYILSLDESQYYLPDRASFATAVTEYAKAVGISSGGAWRWLRSQPESNWNRAYDCNIDGGSRGTGNYNYVELDRLINPVIWVLN